MVAWGWMDGRLSPEAQTRNDSLEKKVCHSTKNTSIHPLHLQSPPLPPPVTSSLSSCHHHHPQHHSSHQFTIIIIIITSNTYKFFHLHHHHLCLHFQQHKFILTLNQVPPIFMSTHIAYSHSQYPPSKKKIHTLGQRLYIIYTLLFLPLPSGHHHNIYFPNNSGQSVQRSGLKINPYHIFTPQCLH